tara:strand:+ start:2843 stop:3118 length:276 start_codon:yes stop_codon:yes gene_type:complete
MALKPQSLRKNTHVWVNKELVGRDIEKEDLIKLSESWDEKQENFFRKMLRQGGRFNIGTNKFEVTSPEPLYNSKGDLDPGVQQVPGEDSAF